jgi:hypothetical protein
MHETDPEFANVGPHEAVETLAVTHKPGWRRHRTSSASSREPKRNEAKANLIASGMHLENIEAIVKVGIERMIWHLVCRGARSKCLDVRTRIVRLPGSSRSAPSTQ